MASKTIKSSVLSLSLALSFTGVVAQRGITSTKHAKGTAVPRAISQADSILNKARVYGNKCQWNQAERCYLTVLSKQPKNIDARREFAFILSYQPNRRQEAIQQFDLVLKNHPNDLNAKFGRAMTFAWIGSFSESETELKALAARKPNIALDVNDEGRTKLPVKLALAEVLNWSGASAVAENAYTSYLNEAPKDYMAYLDLALLQMNQPNQREAAIASFDKVLAVHPNHKQALFGKAMTFAYLRRYEEAIPILQLLASSNSPTNNLVLGTEKLSVQRALAQVLNWSGKVAEATQAYANYVQAFPNDSAARLEYAELLSYQPDYRNQAINQFNLVIEKNQGDKTARFERAMALAYNRKYPEAIAELKALASENIMSPVIDQGNNETLPVGLALAQVLSEAGQLSDCEAVCKNYLAVNPDDSRALRCLGEVLSYQPGQHGEEAVAIFQKILDKNPNNAIVRLDLVNTLVWMGDKPRANAELAALRLATANDVSNSQNADADIQKQLGSSELWVGNADESLRHFRLALAISGDRKDPQITDGIGQSYIVLGRPLEAESVYREGLIYLPKEGRFYFGLAEAAALQGNDQEATKQFNLGLACQNEPGYISDLLDHLSESQSFQPLTNLLCESILNSNPNDLRALRLIAPTYADDETKRGAGIEYLRKYVALAPQDEEMQEYLAQVLGWDKYTRKESLAMYQALLDKQPDNLNLLARYAEVLSWSGKIGTAKRDYRLILSQIPTHRDSMLGLGRCLDWTGDYLSAEKILHDASTQYPHDFEITLARAMNFRDLGRIDRAMKLLQETSGTKLSAR
jgi:predicted Zn-dependent protease